MDDNNLTKPIVTIRYLADDEYQDEDKEQIEIMENNISMNTLPGKKYAFSQFLVTQGLHAQEINLLIMYMRLIEQQAQAHSLPITIYPVKSNTWNSGKCLALAIQEMYINNQTKDILKNRNITIKFPQESPYYSNPIKGLSTTLEKNANITLEFYKEPMSEKLTEKLALQQVAETARLQKERTTKKRRLILNIVLATLMTVAGLAFLGLAIGLIISGIGPVAIGLPALGYHIVAGWHFTGGMLSLIPGVMLSGMGAAWALPLAVSEYLNFKEKLEIAAEKNAIENPSEAQQAFFKLKTKIRKEKKEIRPFNFMFFAVATIGIMMVAIGAGLTFGTAGVGAGPGIILMILGGTLVASGTIANLLTIPIWLRINALTTELGQKQREAYPEIQKNDLLESLRALGVKIKPETQIEYQAENDEFTFSVDDETQQRIEKSRTMPAFSLFLEDSNKKGLYYISRKGVDKLKDPTQTKLARLT